VGLLGRTGDAIGRSVVALAAAGIVARVLPLAKCTVCSIWSSDGHFNKRGLHAPAAAVAAARRPGAR